MKFHEISKAELSDWQNNPVTEAYLSHLTLIGLSFQQDALAKARKHEPGAYETGKADGIDDAISIAKGER